MSEEAAPPKEVAQDAQHLPSEQEAQLDEPAADQTSAAARPKTKRMAKRKARVSRPAPPAAKPSRPSRLMSLSPQAPAALVAAGDVPEHALTKVSFHDSERDRKFEDTATEGIAMHLQHLLRDMMHNTCFTIQGLNRPCQTTDDKIIYFHVFFLGQMRWTVLFPS